MEKWFCIWQISDNPKICLYLARPSPTSGTDVGGDSKTRKVLSTNSLKLMTICHIKSIGVIFDNIIA